MTGVVDRIENDILVIEFQDKMYNVSIDKCIGNIHEGDGVQIEMYGEEIISVKYDEDETKNRKKYIEELIKNMWEN